MVKNPNTTWKYFKIKLAEKFLYILWLCLYKKTYVKSKNEVHIPKRTHPSSQNNFKPTKNN